MRSLGRISHPRCSSLTSAALVTSPSSPLHLTSSLSIASPYRCQQRCLHGCSPSSFRTASVTQQQYQLRLPAAHLFSSFLLCSTRHGSSVTRTGDKTTGKGKQRHTKAETEHSVRVAVAASVALSGEAENPLSDAVEDEERGKVHDEMQKEEEMFDDKDAPTMRGDDLHMDGDEDISADEVTVDTSAMDDEADVDIEVRKTRKSMETASPRHKAHQMDTQELGEDGEGQQPAGLYAKAPLTEGDTPESKRLADAFPDLATEYVAAGKLNTIPVDDLMIDAADVVNWMCPQCRCPWRCGVFVRCVLKTNCPSCTSAAKPNVEAVRPDLSQLWDTTRNDPFDSLEELPVDSRKQVYWKCPGCSQSYKARVKDRVQDKAQCPSCALAHVQSAEVLARNESMLALEWHPLKNGDLRLDQMHPSDKSKLWWLCSACGHEWEATLGARLSSSKKARGNVCPACKGHGIGGSA